MIIDPTKTHEVLQHKHDRPLTACRFDPTGRFVFFGAEDNLVHRFDIQTKTVTPFAAHDSWVRALGCSPDGKLLYTGGYDGRLICWPDAAEKPEPLRIIDAHHGWLRALAVSPDGSRLATCGNDNLIKLWDAKLWDASPGKLIAELAGHTSHVYNVAFHPSGETLVSCDLKGVLKEWDASTGALQRDLAPADKLYKYDTAFRADIGGARCMAFSADGTQLAIGGITNVTNAFAGIGNIAIELVNMADGKLALELQAKDKINGLAWGLAHHPGVPAALKTQASSLKPDPSSLSPFWIALAGGGGGGWLYFFKGDYSSSPKDNTATEFHKLKLPTDGRDLALSPDKKQLAVAHSDKTLRLYALHDK